MEDEESTPVDVVDERYELLRELGPGRRATTWYGRDRREDRAVVVKQLELGEAPDWKAVELFEREARTLQALDLEQTPNYIDHIAPEEGDEDLDFYLIYEYVEGVDLETFLGPGESLDNFEVRYTTHKLLQILADLHDREPPIVHRDVKPSNIVRRPDGSLALIDFGAVQLVTQDTVGGSTIIGTTGYFPPEQLMGRATPASDLYGVGATAVHLLTGRNPSQLEVEQNRIQFRDEADVRPDFARFLDKLLAPAPEDRFEDAGEALAYLESEVLTRQSLGHRIASSVRHAARRGRRALGSSGIEAAAGMCVVLAVAAVVVADRSPRGQGGEAADRGVPTVAAGELVETFEDGAAGWESYGPVEVESGSSVKRDGDGSGGIRVVGTGNGTAEPNGIEKPFAPTFEASTLRVRFGGDFAACAAAGIRVADGRGRTQTLWQLERGGDGPVAVERKMRTFELPSVDRFVVRIGTPRESGTGQTGCGEAWTMAVDRLAIVSSPPPPASDPDEPSEDDEDEPTVVRDDPPPSDPPPETCSDVPVESADLVETFDDGDLEEWTPERETRRADFEEGRVRFEGTTPKGLEDEWTVHRHRHGSKAIWRRIVRVDQLEGLTMAGRFKMELLDRRRDQTTAVTYTLLDEACRELGSIQYYTRWEGKRGNLGDACRADARRGWCTLWGENPAVRKGKHYKRDLKARGTWETFEAELGSLVDEHLSKVDPKDVAMIRVEIKSKGAWSRNGRGIFDEVRLEHTQDGSEEAGPDSKKPPTPVEPEAPSPSIHNDPYDDHFNPGSLY